MLSRAINWYCYTGRPALVKRVCAKHWLRSYPFICTTSECHSDLPSIGRSRSNNFSIFVSAIRFSYTHLFEINSHSLFSKWFSEVRGELEPNLPFHRVKSVVFSFQSGKLVLKLFASIKLVADHPQSLVIILIDEIESIAYARESVSANEPSDSLRVVNAVLTQLDQLRSYSNVLVLTTSNLTSTIDLAFIDRADLKQYVGEPNHEAINEIYDGAINELLRTGIIETEIDADGVEFRSPDSRKYLKDIAHKSEGLSGRTLRKLPLLAHAWFIQKDQVTLNEYLAALDAAVKKNRIDALHMQGKVSQAT